MRSVPVKFTNLPPIDNPQAARTLLVISIADDAIVVAREKEVMERV